MIFQILCFLELQSTVQQTSHYALIHRDRLRIANICTVKNVDYIIRPLWRTLNMSVIKIHSLPVKRGGVVMSLRKIFFLLSLFP